MIRQVLEAINEAETADSLFTKMKSVGWTFEGIVDWTGSHVWVSPDGIVRAYIDISQNRNRVFHISFHAGSRGSGGEQSTLFPTEYLERPKTAGAELSWPKTDFSWVQQAARVLTRKLGL